MEPMELRTYTGLWQMERRLYKLYDYTLPMPVSVRQLGVFFGFAIPWIVIVKITHVPFAPPFGHLVWIAPPVLVAWYANKPVAEGKRLSELILSHVRYWTQPRRWARLAPTTTKPVTTSARVQVWRSHHAPTTPPEPPPGEIIVAPTSGIVYHHSNPAEG